jgi:hypothetical protein
MDIEKERAITDALKMNLEFASGQSDISPFFVSLVPLLLTNSDSSPLPATHKTLSVKGSIYKSRYEEAD